MILLLIMYGGTCGVLGLMFGILISEMCRQDRIIEDIRRAGPAPTARAQERKDSDMATKRKTAKQKREECARQMLRWRVADILSGACGAEMDEPNGSWLALSDAPRAIGAIKERLIGNSEDLAWLSASHMVDRYETVKSLTDLLYRNGIRA